VIKKHYAQAYFGVVHLGIPNNIIHYLFNYFVFKFYKYILYKNKLNSGSFDREYNTGVFHLLLK